MPPIDLSELDEPVRGTVAYLRDHGIPTYESCAGGKGHASAEPFVKFGGNLAEAMYAMALILFNPALLRPFSIQQVWTLVDGHPEGPHWELRFYPAADTEWPWTWPGR